MCCPRDTATRVSFLSYLSMGSVVHLLVCLVPVWHSKPTWMKPAQASTVGLHPLQGIGILWEGPWGPTHFPLPCGYWGWMEGRSSWGGECSGRDLDRVEHGTKALKRFRAQLHQLNRFKSLPETFPKSSFAVTLCLLQCSGDAPSGWDTLIPFQGTWTVRIEIFCCVTNVSLEIVLCLSFPVASFPSHTTLLVAWLQMLWSRGFTVPHTPETRRDCNNNYWFSSLLYVLQGVLLEMI